MRYLDAGAPRGHRKPRQLEGAYRGKDWKVSGMASGTTMVVRAAVMIGVNLESARCLYCREAHQHQQNQQRRPYSRAAWFGR